MLTNRNNFGVGERRVVWLQSQTPQQSLRSIVKESRENIQVQTHNEVEFNEEKKRDIRIDTEKASDGTFDETAEAYHALNDIIEKREKIRGVTPKEIAAFRKTLTKVEGLDNDFALEAYEIKKLTSKVREFIEQIFIDAKVGKTDLKLSVKDDFPPKFAFMSADQVKNKEKAEEIWAEFPEWGESVQALLGDAEKNMEKLHLTLDTKAFEEKIVEILGQIITSENIKVDAGTITQLGEVDKINNLSGWSRLVNKAAFGLVSFFGGDKNDAKKIGQTLEAVKEQIKKQLQYANAETTDIDLPRALKLLGEKKNLNLINGTEIQPEFINYLLRGGDLRQDVANIVLAQKLYEKQSSMQMLVDLPSNEKYQKGVEGVLRDSYLKKRLEEVGSEKFEKISNQFAKINEKIASFSGSGTNFGGKVLKEWKNLRMKRPTMNGGRLSDKLKLHRLLKLVVAQPNGADKLNDIERDLQRFNEISEIFERLQEKVSAPTDGTLKKISEIFGFAVATNEADTNTENSAQNLSKGKSDLRAWRLVKALNNEIDDQTIYWILEGDAADVLQKKVKSIPTIGPQLEKINELLSNFKVGEKQKILTYLFPTLVNSEGKLSPAAWQKLAQDGELQDTFENITTLHEKLKTFQKSIDTVFKTINEKLGMFGGTLPPHLFYSLTETSLSASTIVDFVRNPGQFDVKIIEKVQKEIDEFNLPITLTATNIDDLLKELKTETSDKITAVIEKFDENFLPFIAKSVEESELGGKLSAEQQKNLEEKMRSKEYLDGLRKLILPAISEFLVEYKYTTDAPLINANGTINLQVFVEIWEKPELAAAVELMQRADGDAVEAKRLMLIKQNDGEFTVEEAKLANKLITEELGMYLFKSKELKISAVREKINEAVPILDIEGLLNEMWAAWKNGEGLFGGFFAALKVLGKYIKPLFGWIKGKIGSLKDSILEAGGDVLQDPTVQGILKVIPGGETVIGWATETAEIEKALQEGAGLSKNDVVELKGSNLTMGELMAEDADFDALVKGFKHITAEELRILVGKLNIVSREKYNPNTQAEDKVWDFLEYKFTENKIYLQTPTETAPAAQQLAGAAGAATNRSRRAGAQQPSN